MPLRMMNASTAFETARRNTHNRWPERGASINRVEPVAKPAITSSFQLSPGEGVFTIGSCFARNIEAQLERLGFFVPMRSVSILEDTATGTKDNEILFNNYAIPSILNELEWAIDPEKPFDPESCLLKVGENSYADLHLMRALKAAPLEQALARRERIKAGMAQVKNCRVIVITLGLIECWFDKKAGRYLNIAPPRHAAKMAGDRFELHVLSYADVIDYLERVLALLKKFGRQEHKIILTVSPVPLASTFTEQDVIIANCYSKSVLRAACQEIVSKYDYIDYFPSYESVILSDRQVAYWVDMRHVTDEIVRMNVNRMVAAYVGGDSAEPEQRHDLLVNDGKEAMAKNDFAAAVACFREAVAAESTSAPARLGLAEALIASGRDAEVYSALKPLLDRTELARDAAILLVDVCKRTKKKTIFLQELVPVLWKVGDRPSMRALVAGYFSFKEYDEAEATLERLRAVSRHSPFNWLYSARIAIERKQWKEARAQLEEGVARTQDNFRLYELLAETLAQLGDKAGAADACERALRLNPKSTAGARVMQRLESPPQGGSAGGAG